MKIILDIIRYTLIFVLTGFLSRYIFTKKRKDVAKPLTAILSFLLIMSFIPLLNINGQNYSVVKFILEGSVPFGIMFFGYLLALVFLIVKKTGLDYLSAFIYSVSFVFSWIAMIRHIPNEVINADKLHGLTFVFIFLIIPMGSFIFYLPLIFNTKEKLKKTTFVGNQLYPLVYFLLGLEIIGAVGLVIARTNIFSIITFTLLITALVLSVLKKPLIPALFCLFTLYTSWRGAFGTADSGKFAWYMILTFLPAFVSPLLLFGINETNKILKKSWNEVGESLRKRNAPPFEIEKIKEYWLKNRSG